MSQSTRLIILAVVASALGTRGALAGITSGMQRGGPVTRAISQPTAGPERLRVPARADGRVIVAGLSRGEGSPTRRASEFPCHRVMCGTAGAQDPRTRALP